MRKRTHIAAVALGAIARALDLDLEDAKTIRTLAYGATIVIGAAGTAGIAIRVFLITSGFGGG